MKFVFPFILLLSVNLVARDLTPQEIIRKSENVVKLPASEAVSTLTIMDAKGRERVRKTAQVTKLYDNGKTEKRLVRFLEPADVKGTGLLSIDYTDQDDDMWLYMPALRKTRRIVSSEKSKSFMGSEFSYADMTPPNLEDFTYTMLPEEQVNGEPCYVIESIPVDEDIADENGFSKRILYMSKNDFVIRKSVYYDLDGDLWKELLVGKVEMVDAANKLYRPMNMTMENKQNDRKSIMMVEKLQVSTTISDDYFTTRYLERE